jgi:hypothetical protein
MPLDQFTHSGERPVGNKVGWRNGFLPLHDVQNCRPTDGDASVIHARQCGDGTFLLDPLFLARLLQFCGQKSILFHSFCSQQADDFLPVRMTPVPPSAPRQLAPTTFPPSASRKLAPSMILLQKASPSSKQSTKMAIQFNSIQLFQCLCEPSSRLLLTRTTPLLDPSIQVTHKCEHHDACKFVVCPVGGREVLTCADSDLLVLFCSHVTSINSRQLNTTQCSTTQRCSSIHKVI